MPCMFGGELQLGIVPQIISNIKTTSSLSLVYLYLVYYSKRHL